VKLKSSALEATFEPGAGMAGTSLRHRGKELLHGDGIPLLYPWANRLAGFEYAALGERVTLEPDSTLIELDQNGLPIHGLLGAWSQWQLEEAGSELSAMLDFGAHANLLRFFPFPHELRIDVQLDGPQLQITTTVNANQGAAVPVSFGFHPYFRLPGAPREEWRIEIPVGERLLLDDDMIPTGGRQPAGELDGPLAERSFDDGFASLVPGRPFALEAAGRRLEVRFDDRFPFAQVYSPPGAEFICFEPMTAPTNALSTGENLPIVKPGETFRASWTVSVGETG
jgi:galactose mutarotase-like enzyme